MQTQIKTIQRTDKVGGKYMEGRNSQFKPTHIPRSTFYGSPGHNPEDWRRKDEGMEEE